MTTPILVIDLEATCCDQGTIPPEQMEIIEVGAVWAKPNGETIETFQRFVKPLERPKLTFFCQSITHIEQDSIDAAPYWAAVAGELSVFSRRYTGECWGSWGAYGRRQIERECARHGIENPLVGLPYVNLKGSFAKARNIKQVGMTTALQIVGLKLEGTHHRALADAQNIARLLPWVMIEDAYLINMVYQAVKDSNPEAIVNEFDSGKWLRNWLTEPLPTLGGVAPVKLMGTPQGRTLVTKVLMQALEGSFA